MFLFVSICARLFPFVRTVEKVKGAGVGGGGPGASAWAGRAAQVSRRRSAGEWCHHKAKAAKGVDKGRAFK